MWPITWSVQAEAELPRPRNAWEPIIRKWNEMPKILQFQLSNWEWDYRLPTEAGKMDRQTDMFVNHTSIGPLISFIPFRYGLINEFNITVVFLQGSGSHFLHSFLFLSVPPKLSGLEQWTTPGADIFILVSTLALFRALHLAWFAA